MNPSLQGYLAAMEESLAEAGSLADAASEMRAVADMVDASNELTLAIDDGSVPSTVRRAVLDDLLEGKVRSEVRRLVHQAVTVVPAADVTTSFHWLATRLASAAGYGAEAEGSVEDLAVLGRMGSRNRVSGYAAAVFEGTTTTELEEIEDQLFRFARTVENNRALRTALGDRDLPVSVRQQVIVDLFADKVLPATKRLAAYAVRGGRARDIVATLDALVEDAARARGWRVARVHSANVGGRQPAPEPGGGPGPPDRGSGRAAGDRGRRAVGRCDRGGGRPAGGRHRPSPIERIERAPPRIRGGLPHSRGKGNSRWLS